MSRILIAVFSATGRTAKMAPRLAAAAGDRTDVFSIQPDVPYTKADLNWLNKNSRSSVEMNNKSFRPAIKKDGIKPSDYDTIFLGFPIWWYVAPTIVNTFLEAHDFSGKKIILFATSGGSKFGNTVKELSPSAPGAIITEGAILNGIVTEKRLAELLALPE